jgi:AraC-like DNA-binding protein
VQTYSDGLTTTLHFLRIHGAVLLREKYRAPWRISVPNSRTLSSILQEKDHAHVVAFHFVEQGSCRLTLDDSEGFLELEAGDLAICFSGPSHQLSLGNSNTTLELQALLNGSQNLYGDQLTQSDTMTALTCGAFIMYDISLNPLVAALPPVLHLSGKNTHMPGQILAAMQAELAEPTIGTDYVLHRYAELLCAEVIRSYAGQISSTATNWLRAIRDPVVGKVLASVHANPGQDWNVAKMAQLVSLSPSRFAARFVVATGVAPMTYLSRWRMNLAGHLLSTSQQDISHIATHVGYENVPAFHRAFKKIFGSSPDYYRKLRRAA